MLRIGDDARVAQKEDTLMTVVCAWCQHQGRTTVLREKEPFDWPVVSHGICEEHSAVFLAQVRERKASAALNRLPKQ